MIFNHICILSVWVVIYEPAHQVNVDAVTYPPFLRPFHLGTVLLLDHGECDLFTLIRYFIWLDPGDVVMIIQLVERFVVCLFSARSVGILGGVLVVCYFEIMAHVSGRVK